MIHTLVNINAQDIDNSSNGDNLFEKNHFLLSHNWSFIDNLFDRLDDYENDFEETDETLEEVEDEYDRHANDECDSVDDLTENPNSLLRNNYMFDTSAARPQNGRDDEAKSSKESFYYGSINESITMQMKADSADYHDSKGGDEGRRYLERKNSIESIGNNLADGCCHLILACIVKRWCTYWSR